MRRDGCQWNLNVVGTVFYVAIVTTLKDSNSVCLLAQYFKGRRSIFESIHLTIFSFGTAQNNLGGTLPSELIAFSKLQSIDVYSNIIGGSIPSAMETLTDLSLIDLEENLLTGPAFLDISSLRELSSYRVSLNFLSGTISDVFYPGVSSSLQELWFAKNALNGSIPESLFSQNTELQSFIAYGNKLSGTIPSSIGLLKNLVKLQLHNNEFASTIPNELFGNTALEELRLDRNMFEGTISTLLGDLVNLVDLRLGENLFTGSLPAEIAKLSNLGK